MSKRVKAGKVYEGYMGGYFGRDSYGRKLCIHSGEVDGIRYAVFYIPGGPPNYGYHDGYVTTLSGDELKHFENYVKENGSNDNRGED